MLKLSLCYLRNFFQTGSFSNVKFADTFDNELLTLWHHAERDTNKFRALVQSYPNAARVRLIQRLTSQTFKRKRRIQYAVGRSFSHVGNGASPIINVLAILIFIAFIIIMFS